MNNKNFEINEEVVCNWGSNKGLELVVKMILPNGYSLKIADGSNDKNYFYDDVTLVKKGEKK